MISQNFTSSIVTPQKRSLIVQKTLHQTNRAGIHQVIDTKDNRFYILKIFNKYIESKKYNLHGKNEYSYACYFNKHHRDNSEKSFPMFSHIVPVIETFESPQNWFILFEYLGENDLQHRVANYQCYKYYYPQQFPVETWYEKARHVAFLLLEALAQLHSNNIYHLDISLENIFYEKDQVYLIDFESMLTTSNPIIKREQLCTVCWKSHYTPRDVYMKTPIMNVSNIDVYQLGITLFVLFVTQYPYDKIDSPGYVELMEYGVVRRCQTLGHKIDDSLANLLDLMLGTCGKPIISASKALEHPFFLQPKAYSASEKVKENPILPIRSPSPIQSCVSVTSYCVSPSPCTCPPDATSASSSSSSSLTKESSCIQHYTNVISSVHQKSIPHN